jgi:hypothetical protein
MIKFLKCYIHKLTVAITLGAMSAGFTAAATAASTYDASAGLVVTLNSVTDLNDNDVSDGWSVMIEGIYEPLTSMDSTGDASANAIVTTTIDAYDFVFLNIGDSVTQTATSGGAAINGTATSDAFIGVYFQNIGNFSGQSLKFNFNYDITATAMAMGDEALASALVELIGSGVNISANANADSIIGPSFDDQSTSGSFIIELTDGGFAQMNSTINSNGSAVSAVPIPTAAWLFGSGLMGLIGISRRK